MRGAGNLYLLYLFALKAPRYTVFNVLVSHHHGSLQAFLNEAVHSFTGDVCCNLVSVGQCCFATQKSMVKCTPTGCSCQLRSCEPALWGLSVNICSCGPSGVLGVISSNSTATVAMLCTSLVLALSCISRVCTVLHVCELFLIQ